MHPLLARHLARNLPDPPDDALGVILHQQGEMRLDPDRPWMPFTAEQRVRADRTAFVWHARFRMAPLVTGVVEDAYEDGEGRLDARIWGIIPVAHARGLEVDRGEAQRYLAELPWCPLAIANNAEIVAESLSSNTVRVHVHDADTYVDLTVDDEGDIIGARTLTRSRGDTVQPWAGRFSDYREFGGVRMPARGQVWWEAPEGDFLYWRGTITDVSWWSTDPHEGG